MPANLFTNYFLTEGSTSIRYSMTVSATRRPATVTLRWG